MILPEHFKRRDYNRAQLNADQWLVAVGYGSLWQYKSRDACDLIRNSPAAIAAYEDEIRSQVRRALLRDGFSTWVGGRFIPEQVDPSLQARAADFFRNLGWTGKLL